MLSQDWSLILSSYDRGSRFPFPKIESDMAGNIDYMETPSIPVTATEQPIFSYGDPSVIHPIIYNKAGILEGIPTWAKVLGIGAIALLLLRK